MMTHGECTHGAVNSLYARLTGWHLTPCVTLTIREARAIGMAMHALVGRWTNVYKAAMEHRRLIEHRADVMMMRQMWLDSRDRWVLNAAGLKTWFKRALIGDHSVRSWIVRMRTHDSRLFAIDSWTELNNRIWSRKAIGNEHASKHLDRDVV